MPDIARSVRAAAAPGREPSAAGWVTGLWQRMRRLFWLKLFGTSAFMAVFFVGYFHVLRFPVAPVTVMPLTVLDEWIPFQPGWLAPYLSLWLYVGFAPGLLLGFRALAVYASWMAALSLSGLACFYFWPTAVPATAPVDLAAHPAFAALQGVDAAGNACPSLHVAAAMFTALWLDHLFRRIGMPGVSRVLNALWFLAIAYSTMAIKQHVVLDAVAGALLGVAFALPSLRWQPRSLGA